MTKVYSSATLILVLGLLVGTSTACSRADQASLTGSSTVGSSTAAEKTEASPHLTQPGQAQPVSPVKASAPAATTAKHDPFQRAVERASSAYKISKSAQSRDDWRLVVNRWQQAIELMKAVPSSSSHRTQVQQKLAEYQQNLTYAQRQANRPTTTANPDGVIVIPPQLLPKRPDPGRPAPVAAAAPQIVPQASHQTSPKPAPQAAAGNSRTFYAPIVRREGSTPVIQVMFNASQPFDMIVDTGASGTVITRRMANALNVATVAEANVDTASQKGVIFPLGYVKSIEVGGAVASNVLVAVAGSELDVGLLGHDFFGHYDVTIRENAVEFRER